MNIIKAYLNYCFKSKFRHGLHSPFVYNLQDKGLKPKVEKVFKNKFSHFHNEIKKDTRAIEIKDYGAGSKRLGNRRTVAQIYKNASCGKKYGFFIYKLTKHLKPKTILELGTSLGTTAIMMAEGNQKAKITTVEGCKETATLAKETFAFFNKEKQINLITSTFENHLKNDYNVYDLVFLDGDHRSTSLFEQIRQLEKNMHNETIVIVDDIRWSDDMFVAWQKIIANQNYHLTIDYFRMGVFAKRSHQIKEHFTLRF